FWVRDVDVDGFRCDVAGFVPVDFWDNVRRELDDIKPVFMLAEWESRDLHVRAFDMTYGWSWNETLHKIAHGKADVEALKVYYAWNDRFYQRDAYRMLFVSNHDKNAWEGTEYEQFGDALVPSIVLSVISEGMPLVYNGQEAGSDRRLTFFDKDEIEWREDEQGELYRTLFALKKQHPALWNGAVGGRMVRVPNSAESAVLSFVRAVDGDRVFGAFNFSAEEQTVKLGDGPQAGTWRDAFTGETVELEQGQAYTLPAWGHQVLVGA
ncbi:MAG TPA: alpha-glucosidase C-terminal domain-containing protein, partial [Terrabacter sp.]|nr:alpha-glucosidase C-terminal domain-containing protein [Terrabacter sp.]